MEIERGKEDQKVGSNVRREKEIVRENGKTKVKEEAVEERWPMNAKEKVELMASINHDNDGLDFGEKRIYQNIPAADLERRTIPTPLDPSHGVRDPHLSVDSMQLDPNRLSSTSAGSRGSTRSSNGTGLKYLVTVGKDHHNDNRDSNVSTSTITNAMIVSGPVEVLTMARADLVAPPGTPIMDGLSSAGWFSPTTSGAPPTELTEGAPGETAPKQTSTPASKVEITEKGSLRGGFGGRTPSPDSSSNSHSSSSATTLSSTGPSSLSSANRATGFTGPAIKHYPGWQGEEEARIVTPSSPSPLDSPYKSNFPGGSDYEEKDDDTVEVGDEEEEVVITMVDSLPGSRKGSVAALMDGITGQRRPSFIIPPVSSHSPTTREPHPNSASPSQVPSPLDGGSNSMGPGGLSPTQPYPGLVSNVLSKTGLEVYVDGKVDPRDYFEGLTEVAEGESGFVYQAKVVRTVPGSKLTRREPQPGSVVAIKAVQILPSGSSKLEDLRKEVEVMKRVFEEDRVTSSASGHSSAITHVLLMEAMYVDPQEDSLWIRMELMERSLADVVALVEEGRMEKMDEKVVARFASDVSTCNTLWLSPASVGGLIEWLF